VGVGAARLQNARIEDGGLKFSRDKTPIPKGLKEFTRKVYEQTPRVRLTDLLVEVASWTGFTQHFAHLKAGEPEKDPEPILAAILPTAPIPASPRWPAPRQIVSIPVPARPP
jgi:hypothetical protein